MQSYTYEVAFALVRDAVSILNSVSLSNENSSFSLKRIKHIDKNFKNTFNLTMKNTIK